MKTALASAQSTRFRVSSDRLLPSISPMTHTGAMADGNNQIESHGSMKYTPALDGLRAVAILAVLGFHTTQEFLPGGFTGVDVFFVLSGYLITSVILHDI